MNGISIIDARIAIKFWEAWNNDLEVMNFIIENIEDPFFLGPVKNMDGICAKAVQSIGLMNRIDRMPMPTLTDDEYQEIIECSNEIRKN